MTSSLEIIFESHATSTDNEKAIASGWLDPPLSQKGIQQAKELGQRYEKKNISRIYVSDLMRSKETAQIAFNHRAIPILQDPHLREWNYGKYNGLPSEEVERLKIKHVSLPFPEGESLEEVINRFLLFKMKMEAAKGPLLIIGHRAIYYALEFLCNKTPLDLLVRANWKWEAGRRYLLPGINSH